MNEQATQQALHTKLRGQAAAKVIDAELLDDGTAVITLVAPIEPAAVAMVRARLQPTERARIAWKMSHLAMGLQPGEDIKHAIGRVVLITCTASCDDWGVWHTNSVRRWNRCRPDQADACNAALDRIMPQLDQIEAEADKEIEPAEEIPAMLDIDTPEEDLPF